MSGQPEPLRTLDHPDAKFPRMNDHSAPVDVAATAATDGLSVRGAVSIQVYGLNRLRLVQERAPTEEWSMLREGSKCQCCIKWHVLVFSVDPTAA